MQDTIGFYPVCAVSYAMAKKQLTMTWNPQNKTKSDIESLPNSFTAAENPPDFTDMWLDTIYCLLFVVKNFCVLCGLLHNCKSFLANFCMWIHYESLQKLVTANVFRGMKVKTWRGESFSPWMISNIATVWEKLLSVHNYKCLAIPIIIIWSNITQEVKQIIAWNFPWFYSYL